MTKEMFEWITKWQRETFSQATPISAAEHLKDEVRELIQELSEYSGNITQLDAEYADCFLLLFGSASLAGMTYDEICKAIIQKMEINKQRKWGKVNEQGYIKHEPESLTPNRD